MTVEENPMIGCAGGCDKKIAVSDVDSSGWSYLHITGRSRCGACERALLAASKVTGAPHRPGADTLPPHSIGALKKLPVPSPLHEKVKS
jgi:hypothetical protein